MAAAIDDAVVRGRATSSSSSRSVRVMIYVAMCVRHYCWGRGRSSVQCRSLPCWSVFFACVAASSIARPVSQPYTYRTRRSFVPTFFDLHSLIVPLRADRIKSYEPSSVRVRSLYQRHVCRHRRRRFRVCRCRVREFFPYHRSSHRAYIVIVRGHVYAALGHYRTPGHYHIILLFFTDIIGLFIIITVVLIFFLSFDLIIILFAFRLYNLGRLSHSYVYYTNYYYYVVSLCTLYNKSKVATNCT